MLLEEKRMGSYGMSNYLGARGCGLGRFSVLFFVLKEKGEQKGGMC
jgi:hypothetical protein